MTPFGRISTRSGSRRFAAIAIISLTAWFIALLPSYFAHTRDIVERADDFFYDTFYRLRQYVSRADRPVVIVAMDERSLAAVDKTYHYGWPWPRELWGHIATYLADAGAKAVVFDMVFEERSAYQDRSRDDDAFADLISSARVPIIFGSRVASDGSWGPFAPPVASPRFGAVNLNPGKIYRIYWPQINGRPSLALAAVQASGLPDNLPTDTALRLHYHGPPQLSEGVWTFRHISAASVLAAQLQGEQAANAAGLTPDLFRGKIVLIGATTIGTYDLKATPLAPESPGVEVHATAVDNLLSGQSVTTLHGAWLLLTPLLAALFSSTGIILPRRTLIKTIAPVIALTGILTSAILLFRGVHIVWFPPTSALFATAAASLAAFSFTFYLEDRQRRFMLKALSKVVSPAVAEQLARDPSRLVLGTLRTDVTVVFTDLAGFTDLSEAMDVQKVSALLNHYLGEMSDQVLLNDGTIDKYIGDAVMCFWNAPLPQPDHAARACRAALAIIKREQEIQPELQAYGAKKIYTRIGINTTPVGVGFVGSSHLFNYTVLGDGVNLASRLEGANKLYGTQILVAESTAVLVRDQFVLRQIDVLRVKGKQQPLAVFEVLDELKNGTKWARLVSSYESAFAHYRSRNWDDAQCLLLELQADFADDGPVKSLLERIEKMRFFPPPDDWDGVYVATSK